MYRLGKMGSCNFQVNTWLRRMQLNTNGIDSSKWRLTDKYLTCRTLADSWPGRGDDDQCNPSEFLHARVLHASFSIHHLFVHEVMMNRRQALDILSKKNLVDSPGDFKFTTLSLSLSLSLFLSLSQSFFCSAFWILERELERIDVNLQKLRLEVRGKEFTPQYVHENADLGVSVDFERGFIYHGTLFFLLEILNENNELVSRAHFTRKSSPIICVHRCDEERGSEDGVVLAKGHTYTLTLREVSRTRVYDETGRIKTDECGQPVFEHDIIDDAIWSFIKFR